MTYSSMLTGFLDLFGLLLTVCDSSFVSVRNEPRIFLQKSVIFVCKGRATYWNGIKILDGLCIQSNRCSQPWLVGFESIKWQVDLKPYLGIYALQWSLISNSCLQRLCLLIVGVCSTGSCGSINYLRLAIFIKTFKTTSSDHYFSTMNWIIPTIWVWIAWPFVLELPALLRPFLRCNFSN